MAGDTYTKYNTEVKEVEELYKEAIEAATAEINSGDISKDNEGLSTIITSLRTIKNIAIKALKKQV